ncbi:hypothetical protein ABZ863_33555 [Saccharomonospora sp. NPDC046836]|uniref:hypothetical protein n=1 Tax=Saccharomonospora sp. NPDC046836 TaxID=3156921 RepID=UPI0033F228D3
MAVTVIAILPVRSLYSKGTTARSPTFSSVPGAVISASPAGGAALSDVVLDSSAAELSAALVVVSAAAASPGSSSLPHPDTAMAAAPRTLRSAIRVRLMVLYLS